LTHPVRLSALAALDIQRAREWHDAQEPGLGDQFLQRVNETMMRIGQNPHQYPTIIEDVRRANLRQFKYGVWYRVKVDGSVVVTCLQIGSSLRSLRRGRRGGSRLLRWSLERGPDVRPKGDSGSADKTRSRRSRISGGDETGF